MEGILEWVRKIVLQLVPYRTLPQDGAYLRKSILTPKQNPQLSLAAVVQLVLGCSWPRCRAGGLPSRTPGGRKQRQPRRGGIKQKSANKLMSPTQVPALTSSILLLLPLWQRRFPAQNHRIRGWKRALRPSSPAITPTPPCLLNRIPKCPIYKFLEHRQPGHCQSTLGRGSESLLCRGSKRLPPADLHRSLSARSCSQSGPADKAGSAPHPARSSSRRGLAAPRFLEPGTAVPTADEHVAKGCGFGREVPWCGSQPRGRRARHRHTGSAHV